MAMNYRIDQALGLVVTRIWGTFTNDDLRDGLSRLMADPRFDPEHRSLVDMRDVAEITVDTPVVAQTARTPLFTSDAQRAIVAPSDHAYGIARIYAAYAEHDGCAVHVFRDFGEAERWLGLT
jgi:hypothetical protein